MRKLIIGLLCLAGLAVLIDFGAAAYAEYRVSRALRVGADLSADPEVTFHGFPFVAQAIDGTYRDVDIRAREVRKDSVRDVAVEANLREVRIPMRELVDRTVRTVGVGEISSRMRIDSTELGQQLGITDLQLSSPPADRSDGTGGSGGTGMTTTGGAIVLMGSVPVGSAGPVKQRISAQAQLFLEGNRLRIVASGLYIGREGKPDTPVADEDLPAVLGLFSKVIDFRRLPFGLAPSKVSAQGGQILVEGQGQNMTVSLDQLQNPERPKP